MKAQDPKPFNQCYQGDISNCQNCADSTIVTRVIYWNARPSCPVSITYMLKHCYCPPVGEKTFVEIKDVSFPKKDDTVLCGDLMRYLYRMWRIPLGVDVDSFKVFMHGIYEQLMDSLFVKESSNYICPNSITYQIYWPGSCSAVCQAIGTDLATGLKLPLARLVPCDFELCCQRTYTICMLPGGGISKTMHSITGEFTCYLPYVPECEWHNGDIIRYFYGTIGENGQVYLHDAQLLLSDVNVSDCKTFCDDPQKP